MELDFWIAHIYNSIAISGQAHLHRGCAYESRNTGPALQDSLPKGVDYSSKCGGKMALGDMCVFLKTHLCSTELHKVSYQRLQLH